MQVCVRSLEDLIMLVFCLSKRDVEILKLIKQEKTVEEVAKKVSISRASAQRYLKTLVSLGLAERKLITGKRGRKYIYVSIPQRELKKKLKDEVEKWYTNVKKLLD